MMLGGSTIRRYCNCGKAAAIKGIDDKGRRRYRSQCDSCRYQATKHRKKYCEWCFVTAKKSFLLEIDHIDGDRSNNSKKNLQTLCKTCHQNKGKIFGDFLRRSNNEEVQ
jgi:hypothetical protein